MFSKKWIKALAFTLSASVIMSGMPVLGESRQVFASGNSQPQYEQLSDSEVSESDDRVLAGSYYEEEAKDLSSGGKTAVDSFGNPFYNLPQNMKEASIEFDVNRNSASSAISNIIGFGDSDMGSSDQGRMYFTGGSYLGFDDGAGSGMDANIDIVASKRPTQKMNFTIDVKGGETSWRNVIAVFASGAVGTKGYKEYAVIRSDCYGWGGGENCSRDGNAIEYTLSYCNNDICSDGGVNKDGNIDNWDDFVAIMKDATISAEIVRTADGISLTYYGEGKSGGYFVYTATTKVNTDAGLCVFFATDNSTITVTPEQGDKATATGLWWTSFTPAYTYDAWDLGGYFQAEDYFQDDTNVHVEIILTKNGFEVYIDGELKYSNETLKNGKTKGNLQISDYASMLKWLKNKARTVWIGGGSFWEDAFHGSISNLKFYYKFDQPDLKRYNAALEKANSCLSAQNSYALCTQESIDALQEVVDGAENCVLPSLTSDDQAMIDDWTNKLNAAIDALVYRTYTIMVKDMAGGSATGLENEGIYRAGDSVILTAVPEEDYEFCFWLGKDIKRVSSLAELNQMVTGDMTYYPVFAPKIEDVAGVAAASELRDITLPQGWSFKDADETVLYGTHSYAVEYKTQVEGQDISYVKTISITADDVMGEKLEGYSLSLSGNIGVNFYMELSEEVLKDEGAYMNFSLPNGTTQKVYVTGNHTDGATAVTDTTVTNGTTYYVFTCEVAAKEMTSDIKAQIIAGDKRGAEYTYTVKDYAEYILNNAGGYDAETVALVKAMLYYGGSAQKYFDYHTEKLASDGIDFYFSDISESFGDITEDWMNDAKYKTVIRGDSEVCTFQAAYLSLKSTTDICVYVKLAEGVSAEQTKFYIGDTLVTPEKTTYDGKDCYKLTVTGVKAKNLASMYTFKVVTGEGEESKESTLSYGAFSYAKTVFDSAYDSTAGMDKLRDVMNGMYLYYNRATAYAAKHSGR